MLFFFDFVVTIATALSYIIALPDISYKNNRGVKMGNFSRIIKTGIICGACFFGGYTAGNKGNSSDYRINDSDGRYFLQDKASGIEYEIIKLDGETYIGDAEHNLNGMRALAGYEFENRRPEIRDSSNENVLEMLVQDVGNLYLRR